MSDKLKCLRCTEELSGLPAALVGLLDDKKKLTEFIVLCENCALPGIIEIELLTQVLELKGLRNFARELEAKHRLFHMQDDLKKSTRENVN